MYERKRFDPFSLIVGILAVIASLVVLRNPLGTLRAFIVLIGILALLEGIFKLVERQTLRRTFNFNPTGWLWGGIFDLIFGLLILFVPSFGAIYMWLTLAIWFILDSLFELWATRFMRGNDKSYYWLSVSLAILGVIIGFALLFSPAFALSTATFLLAFYLMFFGIAQIVRSF
ncbi:HdeD family acid-resistance protein [Furfurilactobacillus sp. WILCCON 0119]|uniref:HdeD family acid-resistance protein n=1 Tax=Furfurilactobacillus entadae TaxID=2922307 RepID=UPI0035EF03AC